MKPCFLLPHLRRREEGHLVLPVTCVVVVILLLSPPYRLHEQLIHPTSILAHTLIDPQIVGHLLLLLLKLHRVLLVVHHGRALHLL